LNALYRHHEVPLHPFSCVVVVMVVLMMMVVMMMIE
jgi:hypothetical protein